MFPPTITPISLSGAYGRSSTLWLHSGSLGGFPRHCSVHHVDRQDVVHSFGSINLMILLCESFDCHGEGLHLPLQGVRGAFGLLLVVTIDLDHAILCLRSGDMANHSFPTEDAN